MTRRHVELRGWSSSLGRVRAVRLSLRRRGEVRFSHPAQFNLNSHHTPPTVTDDVFRNHVDLRFSTQKKAWEADFFLPR